MGTFITSDFKSKDLLAPKVTPMYARDTFTRANASTPGALEFGGYTWSTLGNYNIINNTLSSGDARTVKPADCLIDPGKTEGRISVRALVLGNGGFNGIVFRALGNLGMVYYARSDAHVLAMRIAEDSFTVIESTLPSPGFAAGETMTVEFTANRIICSVNGQITHDVVNSTHSTQTKLGVTTRAAGTTPAVWDDFSFAPRSV